MTIEEAQNEWSRALLSPRKAPRGTQAIRRAFLVLRVVALGRDNGCGLSEVASATGLARPSVRRILTALIAEGMVDQNPRTQRYRTQHYSEVLQMLSYASPIMRRVNELLDEAAAEIGDNVSLTLRSGTETVCVARRLGAYPVQVVSLGIGVRRPIWNTTSSIAMLSRMSRDEALAILQENEPRSAGSGKRSAIDDILRLVQAASRNGYHYRERGLTPGTRALSIPIESESGQVHATLTVTAITGRITPQRILPIVEILQGCSRQLENLILEEALLHSAEELDP